MHLELLSLTDFRSYSEVEIQLVPGGCAFVGPNGQGKTNLVEAIGYVATLGSHRAAGDAPLVRLGAERATVRAGLVRDDRKALVELEIVPGKSNRARINRADVPRAREVLGLLRTVLFAPEDLAIVKGDPSERRRFLDELLTVQSPRMVAVRSEYDRVLKQRNALLKTAGATVRSGKGDLRTLEIWDSHLASSGADLLAARLRLVAELGPLVEKAYDEVSAGGGAATMNYKCSLGPEAALVPDRDLLSAQLLEAISAARSQELDRGVSLVGPHRDDLVLQLGPLPTRGYASHGESWSYALALRLASYNLLRESGDTGMDPVLILDDVFAELDAERRQRLARLVGTAEQVLITAAVPADVPEELAGARYDVMAGEVRRVV
ncbi:DNA replication/repair protein RecF [Sporichthya sp.]|uniref:DNA replication/repair protein RecF n=1 Tax=Sporichthya sp. TaxID=65475 RepID=UPI0017E30B00|nr:DNA replication/repair protein RecF [Sporichthya sp.]MBA3741694.1 DNA replication/repair protein RecF [Sporichthya sp.]